VEEADELEDETEEEEATVGGSMEIIVEKAGEEAEEVDDAEDES